MKRTTLYTALIFCFFLVIGANAQSKKDLSKPKMKLVKEALYKPDNEISRDRNSVLKTELSKHMLYDENEKVIEYARYDPSNETVYEKTIYELSLIHI